MRSPDAADKRRTRQWDNSLRRSARSVASSKKITASSDAVVVFLVNLNFVDGANVPGLGNS